MHENDLSYEIRSCIFNVYNTLGPGLLETAYMAAMAFELEEKKISYVTQIGLPVTYGNAKLEVGYRLDFVIADKVIIEVKSVETLLNVHHKQLITYLKLSGLRLGLLVNFNTADISKSIFRKVNGLV